MNKHIAPQQQSIAIPDNNWDAWPDSSSSLICGLFCKFVDGDWTINRAAVAPDALFLVRDVAVAWVRWEDGKPAEVLRVEPGKPLIKREHLLPPPPENGEDVWRHTIYLYMIDVLTANDVTFPTHTVGGHIALDALRNSIRNMRNARPGAAPIVRLGSAPMKMGNGSERPRPHFEILDWRFSSAPAAAPPAAALPEPATKSMGEDMDDNTPPF
jgi:hypothetical protein